MQLQYTLIEQTDSVPSKVSLLGQVLRKSENLHAICHLVPEQVLSYNVFFLGPLPLKQIALY